MLVNRGIFMPNHSKVAVFVTHVLHYIVLMPAIMKQNESFEPTRSMYFFR